MVTQASERQIRFHEIFSVEKILSAGGFRVVSHDNHGETLIRAPFEENSRKMFDIFNNENKRLSLQNFIEKKPSSKDDIAEFSALIDQTDNYSNLRKKLSTTFEWYVGQLIVKEFKAFSSSFGVVIDNMQKLDVTSDIGDYDTLVVLRNLEILYLECKMGSQSANALTAEHILNAIKRGLALHTAATVMFLEQGVHETDLSRLLENEKHPVIGLKDTVKKIKLPKDDNSFIYRWFDCYFVNANERYGDVTQKLRSVFRAIAATSSLLRIGANMVVCDQLSAAHFKKLGYICEEVGSDQEC